MAAYSHSSQMRFAVTIVAVAILIVVPITLGLTSEIVSLAPPPRLALPHPSHAVLAQLLAVATATSLRAPPLAG